jgi:hypothetical protein
MNKHVLMRLQKWYLEQCNGEWEHGYGVLIDTLDNPGWKVLIDLKGTRWEKTMFEELKCDRAPDDWITCTKKDAQYVGYGDPCKLELILGHFLSQVGG